MGVVADLESKEGKKKKKDWGFSSTHLAASWEERLDLSATRPSKPRTDQPRKACQSVLCVCVPHFGKLLRKGGKGEGRNEGTMLW